MKLVRTVGALGLVGFAAVSGQAAVAAESGGYIGLGVGLSQANIAGGRISSELQGSGLTMTSIDEDNADVGYKLFGGYKFNKYFAVEGGYFNLGKFGFTATTTPPGTFTGSGKFQGLNLDAVGILPLSQKFSAFGRVGYIYTETKDSFSGSGGGTGVAASNPNPEKKDGNYKYGLGAQYDFTYNLGLRAEWERYRVNDAVGNKGDIDMALISLVYTFGAKPAAKAATPPPAYVAPVAAAPVLVIVPVARTQQYCGILDIQFEINKDVIQREEQEKLGVLGTFLRKYPDTTAVIEGHTDEVGTAADNLRLSQRRAESVVSYLASLGIARSRLQAVGYGETRPIADNSTEIGKRLNRRINAIVACATDIEGLTSVPARTTMAMEMEFDTNSANIRQQDREQLRKVANFMKANPRVNATVEGHTSNQQGTAAQAMQLSVRRAESVVNALANLGVDRTRLSVAGFGETRRFAYNTSVEGQQENRRVNIILDFPK